MRAWPARQKDRRRAAPVVTETVEELTERRRKLLELHYRDQISAELFSEEERRLGQLLESALAEEATHLFADSHDDEVGQRFAELVDVLAALDIDEVWSEAPFGERRVLVEELVESVAIFPDHLEVKVAGAPKLNVRLGEVGLKESAISGVGGGTCTLTPGAFRPSEYSAAA